MVAASPSAVDVNVNVDLPVVLTTDGPDSAVPVNVPDDVVQAVADAALQATSNSNSAPPIPLPLTAGWILKESRSQPDYYYYYHNDTGVSSWQPPPSASEADARHTATSTSSATVTPGAAAVTPSSSKALQQHPDQEGLAAFAAIEAAAAAAAAGTLAYNDGDDEETSKKRSSDGAAATTSKRSKPSSEASNSSSSTTLSKVRVLHILKKHKDSRRASSWRQAVVTATREQAMEELNGLIEMLQEESGPDQQATFEELARTESDCSSAKRGGDLGYFGRKKMQPAFEKASFALQVGELSGMVETNSGVHVLLRIG
jgi:NIMA-interacting peptidyl-prolyl cis-trans isomerase 1